MSETPRLRSAFPQTPRSSKTNKRRDEESPLRSVSSAAKREPFPRFEQQAVNPPLVPFDIIDAPSQRLYVVAFYLALNTWRMCEYWASADSLDSTWLFLKWVFIDGIFLFGLPALRIPWLEWAFPTTLALFLLHAVVNIFLMFRIPIPLEAWISALVKIFYDRELSISERRVKPSDILHNSSLILGKQIIHIQPEGSASLNPDKVPFCLDSQTPAVLLPIRLNRTSPVLIELLRFDLFTGKNETITISSKQTKQLKRKADKAYPKYDISSPRDLLLPIKKTGFYQLHKVIDDSKLAVRRHSFDTFIVPCPQAEIQLSPTNRCKGELSNLYFKVDGIPPLKIKYSRKLNKVDHGVSFQSIHPEHFYPPVPFDKKLDSVADGELRERQWARPLKIEIPLNESLNSVGEWSYSIEEVHDGYGNVANYSTLEDVFRTSKSISQKRIFKVHPLPRVSLDGCSSQSYLQAAKGRSIELPVKFHSSKLAEVDDAPYTLVYAYSSEPYSPDNVNQSTNEIVLKSVDQRPLINFPGWYTIKSISSRFCTGEIFEPASCLVRNPPEPRLSLSSEKIYDKCANSSVGLLIDLDLIGTPPFKIRYTVESPNGIKTGTLLVDSLRNQIDFTPHEAGYYRYKFLDISDRVYGPQSLKDIQALEQNVKPPASAHFVGPVLSRTACFGEPVYVDVTFVGESPWILQYELVHNGKRTKHELRSEDETTMITTGELYDGGEYVLGLTSVKDRSNCKRPLKQEMKIDVHPKRPQAAFGQIDRQRHILSLEDRSVEVPVRLEGIAPWTIEIQNKENPTQPLIVKSLWNENSVIQLSHRGLYEITGVHDATCPGSVAPKANSFEIRWIPRPRISTIDSSVVAGSDIIQKPEVCEGDEDGLELKFTGSAPYTVKYEQQCKPLYGAMSIKHKSITAALNIASIQMETSRAGHCYYKFFELSDNLYGFDRNKNHPVTVSQRINPQPKAYFESPHYIYRFCKEESPSDNVIPILLDGVPPFLLEIEIKHHSATSVDTLTIPNIQSKKYDLPIPRKYIVQGQYSLSIKKVRDARACLSSTEYEGSSVRIVVSDAPTIIPLETQMDYCVGERLSFSLSGHSPFDVFYTFNGVQRKATIHSTNFRRIAEHAGEFVITSVSDSVSGRCKTSKNITKTIHELPSVRISRGAVSVVEIQEGGEANIIFEFWGSPPFEFTYTRSSIPRKGKKSQILDTKHDISYDHTKIIPASDEGTYEVIAVKDQFCSFSMQGLREYPDG